VSNRLNHGFRRTHELRKAYREMLGIEAPAVLGEADDGIAVEPRAADASGRA
jgi:hypothetical protein